MSHSNLRHAALAVLAAWEGGDLAGAVRQLNEACDADTEAGGAVENPAVIIKCRGGLVQETDTNLPSLQVLVIDYDTEGCDLSKLPRFPDPLYDGGSNTIIGFEHGNKAEYHFDTPFYSRVYTEKLVEIAEAFDPDQPNEGDA